VTQENPQTKANPFFKASQPAPDLTLLNEAGQKINLSAFWQEKPTLLVFLRHFG
jgi:peroxiredoxin